MCGYSKFVTSRGQTTVNIFEELYYFGKNYDDNKNYNNNDGNCDDCNNSKDVARKNVGVLIVWGGFH